MPSGHPQPKTTGAKSPAQISLRPMSPAGHDFLFTVYAATRQEEIAAWGWPAAQRDAFIRMQFDARRRAYAAAYPSAEQSIVLDGNLAIGSMIICRLPAEIRLVDIALLPEHRNRGIGAHLIAGLISECARPVIPLRLSVATGNRAIHLYERLGFAVKGVDEMYIEMEYLSGENQNS